MRRFVSLVVIALAAAGLAAGSAAAARTAGVTPGGTLRAFVEAAGKGDALRM